ncbi:ATPase, T2SS/T4P/T4SS family [Rhodococcus sp. 1139]|uniref:ATPase, T2SS/T4P/T4SS family n=1 Tax=Rhodococcus sp. 1139 TaxID=1833762 RepID=UPI0008728CCD|nr:ATPase, T2SS/T4P/T4SS family [Rhodococcus sp. 1139]OFE08662.1 type II/IV secretion system protein [Rhodococcus sp. 1139]
MTTDETARTTHKNITDLPFFSSMLPIADQPQTAPEPVVPVPAETADFFRTNNLHDLPPAPRHNAPGEVVQSQRSAAPKIPVDRKLVRTLQREAAELLREHRTKRDRELNDPKNTKIVAPFTADEEREYGRETITRLVKNHVQQTIRSGGETFDLNQEHALIKAIFDAQFRLGPLQDLVEEPHITDIYLNGDAVYVKYPDGHYESRDSVVDSSDELLEWMSLLASRADNGGRPFSRINPSLRLNMQGNHRLSVLGYTTIRPSVAIRIHRLTNITLEQLSLDHRMMPPELAHMLGCAIRGRASTGVGGGMGYGKTTFARALANALPIQTRIGVAETERELFLDELPGRRDFIVDAEMIMGGGERGADGQLAGGFSLSAILYEFVRQGLDFLVVGEIAGLEILALVKALQTANGGIFTTHAYTARGVIDRLANLAQEPPMNASAEYIERQLAEHVDVIVQLATKVRVSREGTTTAVRYVSEVVYVEPGDTDKLPSFSNIYRGYSDGTGVFGSIPQPMLRKLLAGGFKKVDLPPDTLRSFDEERDLFDDEGAA